MIRKTKHNNPMVYPTIFPPSLNDSVIRSLSKYLKYKVDIKINGIIKQLITQKLISAPELSKQHKCGAIIINTGEIEKIITEAAVSL